MIETLNRTRKLVTFTYKESTVNSLRQAGFPYRLIQDST